MAKPSPKPTRKQRIATARTAALARSIGPDAAAAKVGMSKAQWKRSVAGAKRQGVTMAGYFSGQPAPLRERSPQGIMSEANKRVNAAYAPDEAEFSRREKGINAIHEKRGQDMRYYQEWISGQNQALQSEATTANALLAQQSGAIAQSAQQQVAAEQVNAAQTLKGRAGTMADFEGGMERELAASKARGAGMMQAEQTRTAGQMAANNSATSGYQQTNRDRVAHGYGERENDRRKEMTDLGDDRKDTALRRRADAMQEIGRLSDKEIEKAMSNREFSAAAKKLGLEEYKAVQGVKTDRAKIGMDERQARREHRATMAEINENRRKNRISERQARIDSGRADRKLANDIKTGGKSGGKATEGERKAQFTRENVRKAEAVLGSITPDSSKFKGTSAEYVARYPKKMENYLITQGFGEKAARRAVQKIRISIGRRGTANGSPARGGRGGAASQPRT